jgi:hypothetical protein
MSNCDKQIIIEDCPHFIGGCCQEYLDGVCENHKCDLKIIRELEQKLKDKEQECEELKEQLELNTANAVVIDMAQRLYKLKQTLIEIKDYCNKYPQNSIGFKQQILQKISEVEDE